MHTSVVGIKCMRGSQASELDLQTEMATTGSLTHARALMVDEAQEASNTTRRAQSTLPKSVVGRLATSGTPAERLSIQKAVNLAYVAETGEEAGNLHLSMSINPLDTLRMSTPRLAKHQTLGTTIMSRSGRSDKARRAQGRHFDFLAVAASLSKTPACSFVRLIACG